MFFLVAVLAFLSAALLLFWFSSRQTEEVIDRNSSDPPPRSLFAPSEQDLKREHAEKNAREIERREYLAKTEARAIVDESLRKWREKPNVKNASDLLQATAECGLAGDFSRAADEIIRAFRKLGIDGLKDNELAALLNSRIHLLSSDERSSGDLFWLKQEVAKLSSADNFDNKK